MDTPITLNDVARPLPIGKLLDMAEAQKIANRHPQNTCVDAADWLDEDDEPDTPLVRELIERDEMIAIVGQSKAGKSFIALQLVACIACGIPFLGHETLRQPVYIANLEVSRKQYKKRLRRLTEGLGISRQDLKGWLFIDNLKGETVNLDTCRAEAKRHGCTVVVIDPFYQIFEGDESDPNACAAAIAQMKEYQKDNLTLIVIFHSPKGFSGDRQLIDMISGSSMLARFPEGIIGLLNHADSKKNRVLRCILRNYETPDDITLTLDNGIYTAHKDVAPVVETANTRMRRQAEQTNNEIAGIIISFLERNGTQPSVKALRLGVQDECARIRGGKRPGERKIAEVIDVLKERKILFQEERQSARGGATPIGLHKQPNAVIPQGGKPCLSGSLH